jgi:hypothetical protein
MDTVPGQNSSSSPSSGTPPPPPDGIATPPSGGAPPPPPPPAPVGPPPQPEVKLHTMESDTKSIERGDSSPVPESVILPIDEKEPEFKPETTKAHPTKDVAAPPPASDGAGEMPVAPKKKGGKKLLMVLVFVIVIIGLGVAGYFLYDFIFPSSSEEVVTPSAPPAAPSSPGTPPTGTPPPSSAQQPKHSSLFLSPAAETAEIRFESVNVVTINKSLEQLSASQSDSPTLQEVVMFDRSDNQVPWSQYATELLSSFDQATLLSLFQDDFTAWIYYDENGKWPGYAVKLKPNTTIDDALAAVSGVLENTDNIVNFYLGNSGTFGDFQDGTVVGNPVRYSIGSVPGSAFDYGIIKNILMISTSFDGAQEAVRLFDL